LHAIVEVRFRASCREAHLVPPLRPTMRGWSFRPSSSTSSSPVSL